MQRQRMTAILLAWAALLSLLLPVAAVETEEWTESEPVWEQMEEPEQKSLTDPEPETEPVTEGEPAVQPEPESEPVMEEEPAVQPEPETEPVTEGEPAVQPEPESEPVTEEEPAVQPEPDPAEGPTAQPEEPIAVQASVYNPALEPLWSQESEEETVTAQAMSSRSQSLHYCQSLEEVAVELRGHMKARDEYFTIGYVSGERLINSATESGRRAELITLVNRLANLAAVQTGVPTEGDYLRWQYYCLDAEAEIYPEDGLYYHEIDFSPKEEEHSSIYYTTAAEELLVDGEIAALRAALFTDGMSDYEKVRSAYDYITAHVVYDHQARAKELAMNFHSFTCYGALVEGTSVCQGYALLFYRLMLEEGIDCRIITGYADGIFHAWNIVRLGGRYYNLDATWDRGKQVYRWFLLCDASFIDHVREHDENMGNVYDDAAFCAAYPMGTSDYYPLSAPAYLRGSSYTDGLLLTWGKVSGGVRYQIQRYDEDEAEWQTLAATDRTSLLLPGLVQGKRYRLAVVRVDKTGNPVSPRRTLNITYQLRPAPVLLGAVSTAKGVKVQWQGTEGDERYRVYFKSTGGWIKAGETTGTAYTVTGLTSGRDYAFAVRCISADGKHYASLYQTSGVRVRYLVPPALRSVRADNVGVTVQWSGVRGAERYRVYYKSAGGSWRSAGTTTDTRFTVKGLKSGQTYVFTVRCVSADGKRTTSGYDSAGLTLTPLQTPLVSQVQNVKGGVSVRWNRVSGGGKYRVYYKRSGGSWQAAGTATGTAFTVTGLKSGQKYAFSVRCVSADGKTFTSGYDTKGMSLTYVAAPVVTKAVSGTSGVRLSWSRVSGAAAYRVFYRTVGSGWQAAGTTTGTAFTVKGLKSGRSYTFTLRCVSADGRRYTSGYDTKGVEVRCR